MKRKKKSQRLVRPTGRSYAFKFIFRGLITYLLLGVIGFGITFYVYNLHAHVQNNLQINNLSEAIENLPKSNSKNIDQYYNTPLLANASSDKELTDIKRATIHYYLYTQHYNGAYIVYNSNTMEEYVRSSPGIVIILDQGSKDSPNQQSVMYFAEKDRMPELYDDYYTAAFSHCHDNEITAHYSINFDNVFIAKDGSFIPGKCQLVTREATNYDNSAFYNGRYLEGEKITVISEYDYTPKNPENYVEISLKDAKTLDDIHMDLEPLQLLETNISRELMRDLETSLSRDSAGNVIDDFVFGPTEKYGFGTIDITNITTAKARAIDESYYLLSVIRYSIWLDWGRGIAIVYGAAFVVFVILFIIFGMQSYQKAKIAYETESFRRAKTNAMAHDLKTPLTAVNGYIEMLESDMNPEKKAHYINEIKETTRYMNSMVEKNLEMSKLDSGEIALTLVDFDFRQACENIISIYQNQLNHRHLEISIQGELTAKADEKLMRSALENLI